MKRVIVFLLITCSLIAGICLCINRAKGSTMVPELFDSGVPRGESDILAGYYRDAAARLKKIVMHPTGSTQSAMDFRQARAAQQIQQVNRLLADLGKKTTGWVGKNLPTAYKQGIDRANSQAKEVGVEIPAAGVKGSFALIDGRTIEILARDTMSDLNRAANSAGNTAKNVLRATAQDGLSEADINKVLAGGVIEGKPRETIRRLREDLEKVHGEKITVVDKNGDPMEFDAGYYASMVVRTKTREATVMARHERLQQLDLDLVSVVGRVSNNFCTAYLGLVFSLSGNSEKYPPYASIPPCPMHPNCSKSTRPYVEELASDTQQENAEPSDDQQTVLGLGKDTTKLQRAFKDLQLRAQIQDRYATTEKKLFG